MNHWVLGDRRICGCGEVFKGEDSYDEIRMHFLDELLQDWGATEQGRWWWEEFAEAENLQDADRIEGLNYYRATVMNDLWGKHLK